MLAQDRGIFREFATYVGWLVLSGLVTMLIIFSVALVVFQTKTVPPAASFPFFAALWVATYLRLRKTGGAFADIGLTKTRWPTYFCYGALFGTAFMSAIYVALLLAETVESSMEILTGSIILSTLVGMAYIFVQSSTEELIFRGYLLNLFSRKGQGFSIILTSALFSIGHFWHGVNPIGWLNIFLFGVFASQLFYLFNSLWVPIGFHAAWNFAQTYVFAFPMYGRDSSGVFQLRVVSDNPISGGSYGPEGSLLVSGLFLLLIALSFHLNRPKQSIMEASE